MYQVPPTKIDPGKPRFVGKVQSSNPILFGRVYAIWSEDKIAKHCWNIDTCIALLVSHCFMCPLSLNAATFTCHHPSFSPMGIATFWSLTTRKNGDNVGIIGIVGIRNQQLSGDLTNKHVWYICQGDKLWIQWEWWEYIYGTGNLMRWIWYIYIYHPFS